MAAGSLVTAILDNRLFDRDELRLDVEHRAARLRERLGPRKRATRMAGRLAIEQGWIVDWSGRDREGLVLSDWRLNQRVSIMSRHSRG